MSDQNHTSALQKKNTIFLLFALKATQGIVWRCGRRKHLTSTSWFPGFSTRLDPWRWFQQFAKKRKRCTAAQNLSCWFHESVSFSSDFGQICFYLEFSESAKWSVCEGWCCSDLSRGLIAKGGIYALAEYLIKLAGDDMAGLRNGQGLSAVTQNNWLIQGCSKLWHCRSNLVFSEGQDTYILRSLWQKGWTSFVLVLTTGK